MYLNVHVLIHVIMLISWLTPLTINNSYMMLITDIIIVCMVT